MTLIETNGNLWKGIAAGAAAGLAGALAMNALHSLVGRLEGESDKEGSKQKHKKAGESQQEEDATVKAADGISQGLFGHELSRKEKRFGGPAVHFAMGILTGALYGAAAEVAPMVTRGAGLPFGTAVWLGADEVAVPALHLSGPPSKYPPSKHAMALASHFVYGLTTDVVRRGLMRAL